MNLLGIFGPSTSQPSSNQGSTTDPGSSAAEPEASSEDGGTTASSQGSGVPSEQAQAATAASVPPVAQTRVIAAPSIARSGSDGVDVVSNARTALSAQEQLDKAFAPDADEDRARRYAEVAQERLVTQEILSRIPVPVEALPRLEIEAERQTERSAPRT